MTPPTPRTERRSDAPAATAPARRGRPSRRADIFAAALRLFRERGFHATSINDIGAEAGVSGTAIYSHFATKQELLEEAIREGAGRIATGLREALADEAQSPKAALENVVRAYVQVVLENADMNACYVLESRTLDAGVGEPLRRKERALRETWRQRLLAERPELTPAEAQLRVQMAIFSVVALCLHRHRMERAALV
ncbi:MAG: TetR/AcrR family transcriptional regulator, partial [Myxococcales bacterium]|nr:TetR/AcrR family transcriptional regulator [Myxococcales bacterium]